MIRRRKALFATAVIAIAAVCAGLSATAADAAGGAISHGSPFRVGLHQKAVLDDAVVSSNWGGYVVTSLDPAAPTAFSGISARWIAPKATCTRGRTSYSAFWVGLGGFSETSQALEQIGTAADCKANGTAVYSMWYELVPAASVTIKYKVFPGNVITATVGVVGTTVTLQIRNLTRRTRFTKVLRASVVDVSSAEWVAEAPSSCDFSGNCVVLPLTNFGRVSFTSAAAIANGHTGTISDLAWLATPIKLVSDAGAPPFAGPVGQATSVGALPSALSSNGAAFAVDWQAAVSVPVLPSPGRSSGH